MKNLYTTIFSFSILFILFSCNISKKSKKLKTQQKTSEIGERQKNLLTDIIPIYEDGDVNAVIEIPTGTLEKWELNKLNGQIQLELVNTKPRIIEYLGYPGNYGMVPGTLLSTEHGGDGDPLDILVLGTGVERGSILKSKIIGVLYLLDNGEQDHKLIAVSENSPLYRVNSIAELNENYKGISDILQLWFTNYKGLENMDSKGFGERNNALNILKTAINEYKLNNTIQNNVHK